MSDALVASQLISTSFHSPIVKVGVTSVVASRILNEPLLILRSTNALEVDVEELHKAIYASLTLPPSVSTSSLLKRMFNLPVVNGR